MMIIKPKTQNIIYKLVVYIFYILFYNPQEKAEAKLIAVERTAPCK